MIIIAIPSDKNIRKRKYETLEKILGPGRGTREGVENEDQSGPSSARSTRVYYLLSWKSGSSRFQEHLFSEEHTPMNT